MLSKRIKLTVCILLSIVCFVACQSSFTKADGAAKPAAIENVVVIYLENHSFFNLFNGFPGADQTLPEGYKGQRGPDGELYKVLPRVTERGAVAPDPRFPDGLPNAPFAINRYAKVAEKVPDPNHDFFYHALQINGGKMDRFVEFSRTGGLVMGYYDMSESQLWRYAREFTVADHFFQSAFGGSFLNHQWLIAARSPKFENAPPGSSRVVFNSDGSIQKTGVMTEDNYPVNTIQPLLPPYDPRVTEASKRLPPLEHATIGDRLSDKKISWTWYAGGWSKILAGRNADHFQWHHQPFIYFKNFGPDTPGRREHLKDEDDLFADLKAGRLPAVSFFKPVGAENAHPFYSEVASADVKIGKLIEAVRASPYWQKTLIIVTFDEYGGFWDPVAPPKIDRWGPGSRVPAVFVSPHVKRGFVDHTVYETTSILSYLEKRFDLAPLSDRDARANPLSGIFRE